MAQSRLLVRLVESLILSPRIFTDFNRPKEFVKQSRLPTNSEDEESTMGKLPPSDDSDS